MEPCVSATEEAATFSRPASQSWWRAWLRKYWTNIAVVALAIFLWVPRLSGPIDLRWDASVYYVLGTSLATGHGYRISSEPGAPEAIQYPPLLPSFVALHAKLLGTTKPQIVARYLRISYAAIFVVYAIAVLILARRFLSPVFAFVATVNCLLYSETIFFSDLLYAELPFALICVLFVLVASDPRQHSWIHATACFALAAAGFLVRTAGVVLLVAWVLEALIRRRLLTAILRVALALLPVLAWQVHVDRVRSSEGYRHPAYSYQRAAYQYNNVSYKENAGLIDPFHPERGQLQLRILLRRFVTNAPRMLGAIGESVTAKKRAWARLFFDLQAHHHIFPVHRLTIAAILLCSTVTCLGIVILVRRKAFVTVIVLLGSIALALTTPWPLQFTRYLVPVGAFLSISMTLAVVTIRQYVHGVRIASRRTVFVNYALLAPLAVVVGVQLFAVIKMFKERGSAKARMLAGSGWPAARLFVHYGNWQNFERAAQWISANTQPDAIVATSVPHFLNLLTGRLSVIPPLERDPARARQLLDSVPVSYVIIDQIDGIDMSRSYAQPAVQNDPDHWHLTFIAGGTSIYSRLEQSPHSQNP
jgi:hypothetical protein